MSSLLGPSYDYWKSIKQPEEMGMSPGFSLGALATNVDGLLSYVEVLISGSGNASVTGKPLGNKFFLKTTGKCSETTVEKWKKERDEDTAWEKAYEEVENKLGAKEITEEQATKVKNALNEEKTKRDEKRGGTKKQVDRWIYVNNIPDGSIPFIASGADGRGFSSLRGLIPGALGNLGALNPVQLFNGFTAGTYPDCAKITLETVNNDNAKGKETHHIAMIDMVQLNPCSFPNRYNPASGKSCQTPEAFNDLNSRYNHTANTSASDAVKEKPSDIYNNIPLYEMGSLAGSSGVAYQTSHRSPLSYNIDITKSSPMTDLAFDTFEKNEDGSRSYGRGTAINAREVIARHEANASAFYDKPIPTSISPMSETTMSAEGMDMNGNSSSDNDGIGSLYNDLVNQLSSLIERSNSSGEDLSSIRGDTMSQIYYYSLTAIMLYLFYRILYTKKT
jgi:hypothetical protein